MSVIMDKIRTSVELGQAIKQQRLQRGLKAIDIAEHSGRSRDVLNRLEKSSDVTVHSLLDILRAMGLCLRIEDAGLPSLEEMQAHFQDDDDAA
jgi:transcriptional regulator with XRE-family HTH domain